MRFFKSSTGRSTVFWYHCFCVVCEFLELLKIYFSVEE